MIWHWQVSPVALALGPLQLRWYGLLFVGAFLVGQWGLGQMFQAEGRERAQAERLLPFAVLGTVLGARLAHCVFYDPAYYWAHPLAVLRIWEGGLASHGGALGLLLGLWWAARTAQPALPLGWLVDRAALPAAFGAVFVRLANFVNSEIVGTPTGGAWGVVFDAVDAQPRHPVQLYEAAAYALIGLVLWRVYRAFGRRPPQGLMFGLFMLLVFATRVAAEVFKVPQAAYEAGQWMSVGQLLSLPFVALGAAWVWRAWRLRDQQRGQPHRR